jgi:hypothetical protein
MQQALRQAFNQQFTEEKYRQYLQTIENLHPGALDFRNAETPIFIPKYFTEKMLDTCEHILDVITAPNFKALTQRSIPSHIQIPGEDDYPQCMVFDFGICADEAAQLTPQLIEMQGFPSLFAFQAYHSEITANYANVPNTHSAYLNGYDNDSYSALLQETIVGNHPVENVVLLEIFPEQQKTRIDFHCTEKLLGIKTVCITQLIAEGNQLYYQNGDNKIRIQRIYNRIIFDDLDQHKNQGPIVDLNKAYDVEWMTHPNWFYRISKFTLPFIDHPCVPASYFLNEVTQPLQLKNYVLKPLFSFAGIGVVIDVTEADIDAIKDPENWILQRKVDYAPVIETMDEPAKAEIRLFYFWKEGAARPIAAHNLARLSKGKMIGTRYNKDKTWVGGSIAYFEK